MLKGEIRQHKSGGNGQRTHYRGQVFHKTSHRQIRCCLRTTSTVPRTLFIFSRRYDGVDNQNHRHIADCSSDSLTWGGILTSREQVSANGSRSERFNTPSPLHA